MIEVQSTVEETPRLRIGATVYGRGGDLGALTLRQIVESPVLTTKSAKQSAGRDDMDIAARGRVSGPRRTSAEVHRRERAVIASVDAPVRTGV
jgi:hypothetical protein